MKKKEFFDEEEVLKTHDPNYRPPDNPPIVQPRGGGSSFIHEEYKRKIFGTPPPPGSQKPIPPPPLPPGSYHKKPKYWQMRGTSHMQVPNRVSAGIAIGCLVFAFVIDRFYRKGFDRWDKWFGFHMTPQEKIEYDKKMAFYSENVNELHQDVWHTDLTKEHYVNTRRHKDANVRWDIREVDMEVMGIRDMANPFESF